MLQLTGCASPASAYGQYLMYELHIPVALLNSICISMHHFRCTLSEITVEGCKSRALRAEQTNEWIT